MNHLFIDKQLHILVINRVVVAYGLKKSKSKEDHNLHLGENSVKTGYEILVLEEIGFYLQVVHYIRKFIQNP